MPLEAVLQHGQDVPKDAVRYLPHPRESHESIGGFHTGYITRVKQRVNIARVLSRMAKALDYPMG
jgi:hypothetical protein